MSTVRAVHNGSPTPGRTCICRPRRESWTPDPVFRYPSARRRPLSEPGIIRQAGGVCDCDKMDCAWWQRELRAWTNCSVPFADNIHFEPAMQIVCWCRAVQGCYASSRVCMNNAFFSPGRVKSKPQDLKKSSEEVMAITSKTCNSFASSTHLSTSRFPIPLP